MKIEVEFIKETAFQVNTSLGLESIVFGKGSKFPISKIRQSSHAGALLITFWTSSDNLPEFPIPIEDIQLWFNGKRFDEYHKVITEMNSRSIDTSNPTI